MRAASLVDHWKKFKIVLQNLIGTAALFLFVLSAGIHICTWVFPGVAHWMNRFVWAHIAVLILAAAYSFVNGKTGAARNREWDANSPAWVQAVSTALFAYWFLYLAFLVLCSGPKGTHEDVTGVIDDAIQKMIPLEKDFKWYSRDDLFGLRLFSIFWMIISLRIMTETFYRNFTVRFGRYDAAVKKI